MHKNNLEQKFNNMIFLECVYSSIFKAGNPLI